MVQKSYEFCGFSIYTQKYTYLLLLHFATLKICLYKPVSNNKHNKFCSGLNQRTLNQAESLPLYRTNCIRSSIELYFIINFVLFSFSFFTKRFAGNLTKSDPADFKIYNKIKYKLHRQHMREI